MKRWCCGVLLTALVSFGCGKSEPAGVPKDPVPMQKPGQSATPEGGRGKAQPSQMPGKL